MIAEGARSTLAIGLVRWWKWLLVLLAVLTAFLWGRCGGDPDPVPVSTPSFENIEEGLPPDDRGPVRRITHRENPVVREGKAPTDKAKKKAKEFAESYADSTLPAVLPEVKLIYDDDRLDLSVGDSKGVLHRQVTECPQRCEAGVRDNELFSESPRVDALPKWKIAGGVALVAVAVTAVVVTR